MDSSQQHQEHNLVSIVSVPASSSSLSSSSTQTIATTSTVITRSSINSISNTRSSLRCNSHTASTKSTSAETTTITPKKVSHKRNKSMSEAKTVFACANGQVRRMRSILDMRLGCLVAAGMPLEEDGGHMSPLSSPSPMYNNLSHNIEQQPIDIGFCSPPEPPVPPPACIDFDGISDECDAFNLNSPHSVLSPKANTARDNLAANRATKPDTTTEQSAWINQQIKLLTIADKESTSNSNTTTTYLSSSLPEHNKVAFNSENNKKSKVDIFGIPIPTSTNSNNTNISNLTTNSNGDECVACSSTCTLMSTISSSDDDELSNNKDNKGRGIHNGNENESEMDGVSLASASAAVACSVLLAESPSRVDLSALLC